MDANFNRCREAFRVMEEYCRFGLNNQPLSARAKQLRHQLCEAISRLDAGKLLCSRDTDGDVGKTTQVDGQLRRQSIEDCFTAAAKRASEALRALAEASQAIDVNVAAVAEKLRFETYALEKDVVLKAAVSGRFAGVRLYVLINAGPETPVADVLSLTRDCITGGADCLQLRAKGLTDKALLSLAEQFVELCKDGGLVSIINDRVDIAVLSGADGVHLGQDEISPTQAQKLAKTPLIIGASTHTPDELEGAIEAGYDYVAIGPAFASPTKPDIEGGGIDYIQKALNLLEKAALRHVAIGGINQKNIEYLTEFGVRTIAVSSAVCEAKSPIKSCQSLKTALQKSND